MVLRRLHTAVGSVSPIHVTPQLLPQDIPTLSPTIRVLD